MHKFLDPLQIAHELQNLNEFVLPETLVGDKAATVNGTGYIFYEISPLAQEFIDNEAMPNKQLIEIGSGFSNVSIEALRRNVHTYIANDVSHEHLKILVHRISNEFGQNTEEKLHRLKLLLAKVPEQLPVMEQQLDALLIDKVLHFMSPDEIELFLSWVKSSIKKNGKIYILTVSPYNKIFRDQVLPIFLRNVARNIPYPGYILKSHQTINHDHLKNHPNFHIPKRMNFFDADLLQKLLENHNFTVLKTYNLKVPEENGKWLNASLEDSGVTGIVATI